MDQSAQSTPPELIPLPCGLVLRRRSLIDDAAVIAAVLSDLDHLRTWLPWAQQAPSLEETARKRVEAGTAWESGEQFGFALTAADDPEQVLGGCGLHGRTGPGIIEIGYWIASALVGRGVAAQAAAALTRAAFDLPGVGQVEIHCDENNLRSAAVARRLGFALDRVEQNEIETPAESGRNLVWILDRAAYLAGALEGAAGGRVAGTAAGTAMG